MNPALFYGMMRVMDDGKVPPTGAGKATRRARRRNDGRYQLLADNISDVIFTLDTQMRVTYVSPSVTRLLGYTPEEVLSLPWENMLSGASFQVAMGTVAEARGRINEGAAEPFRPTNVNIEIRRKDGTSVWAEVQISFMFDSVGRASGVVGVVRDISERKRVEELLSYQASLVDSISDAVFSTDRKWMIRSWNRAAEDMYGWRAEEVLGKVVGDLLQNRYPDGRTSRQAFRELLRGERWSGEVIYLRRDGIPVNALVSRSLLRDGSGRVSGSVTVARDVTEMKNTVLALKEERERAGKYLDVAGAVILIIGSDERVTLINRMGCEVLGYSREEVIGRNWFDDFVSEQRREEQRQAFRRMVAGEVPPALEFQNVVIRRGGEERTMAWRSTVVRDEMGRVSGRLSSGEDITERIRARERVEDLYESEKKTREHLEREVSRRAEFARVLVHELRTPLTAVLASSELLLEEVGEGTARSLAANIVRGATDLNRRIGELLDLARGEVGMLELRTSPTDVGGLLRDLVEEMRPVALSSGQELRLEVVHPLPQVDADAMRLRQVVSNLLSNAFRFTPAHGMITVRAEAGPASMTIRVSDNGPGVSPSEVPYLFEAYHRSSADQDRRGGLGIGLALSRLLVELHGGRICVDSDVGKGTTVSFSIPLQWGGGRRAHAETGPGRQGS